MTRYLVKHVDNTTFNLLSSEDVRIFKGQFRSLFYGRMELKNRTAARPSWWKLFLAIYIQVKLYLALIK
jgi:hypothetical protein